MTTIDAAAVKTFTKDVKMLHFTQNSSEVKYICVKHLHIVSEFLSITGLIVINNESDTWTPYRKVYNIYYITNHRSLSRLGD